MAEEESPWDDSSNHSDTSDDEFSKSDDDVDYFPIAFKRIRKMKLDPRSLNTKQKRWSEKLMNVEPVRTYEDMQKEFGLKKRTLNYYSNS